MQVHLVTKNKGKLMAAQSVFGEGSIELLPVEKDYPEIQADSSIEIARYTALEVAKETNKPAVREDHSIFLHGLSGTPGPYMAFFEKRISPELLLKLLEKVTDRTGYFEVGTSLAFPDGTSQDFSFTVPFSIATEMRGELQGGWNTVIILDGETRTLAEYPETERTHIWNQNYLKIRDVLLQKN